MESELLPPPAGKDNGSAPLEDLKETNLGPARYCNCGRKQITGKTADIEQEEKRVFPSIDKREKPRSTTCCIGQVLYKMEGFPMA